MRMNLMVIIYGVIKKDNLMKIKKFESWVSDATGNVSVNYGDKKPKISRIVTLVEKYIEDHFENIFDIDLQYLMVRLTRGVNQVWPNYQKITIRKENKIEKYYMYYIVMTTKSPERDSNIDISEYEYKHISDFIYNINKEYRRKEQKSKIDDILLEIDPVKKASKKYNMK